MKVKKIDFCHMQSKDISIWEIHKYIFLPVIVRSIYRKPMQVRRRGALPSLHKFSEAKKKKNKKKKMLCSVVSPLCLAAAPARWQLCQSSLSPAPYLSSPFTAQAGVQLLH